MMNWEHVLQRIDDDVETRLTEATSIIHELLSVSVKHQQNEKQAMLDAGVISIYLV